MDFNESKGLRRHKMDEDIALMIEHCDTLIEAWELLKEQHVDIGFTAKHTLEQKLTTITPSSCSNQVGKYIQALECGFPDWWCTSVLIANLDGHFKDFAQRVAIRKELPSFETVAAELRQIKCMTQRDSEASAHRAQVRKFQQAYESKGKGSEAKKDAEKKTPFMPPS